jgi:hypothetical protein
MRGSIATIISIVNSGADDSFVILGICPEQSGKRPVCSPCSIYDGGISMTKLKTLGAICLAVSLAAASPALARGGHVGGGFHGGGFHGGGAHFAGGGFRGGGYRGGGIGPGIAAGLIGGAVLGGAYGYYDAPGYYDDSYGYYDNGPYDSSDGANAFN